LIILSTPALARSHGRYLFQSIVSTSVPDAGTVRAAEESGAVKVLERVEGAYDGARRSNSLRVPSVEQVATTSGWWGEKRAW
jgi:hypothetical protein